MIYLSSIKKAIYELIEKNEKIDIFYHNDLDGKMSMFLMAKFILENFSNKLINFFSINYDEKYKIYNSENFKIILDFRFRFGEKIDFSKINLPTQTFKSKNTILDYIKKTRLKSYILIDHHNKESKLNIGDEIIEYLETSEKSASKMIFDLFFSDYQSYHNEIGLIKRDVDFVNRFDTGQYNFNNEEELFLFFSEIARISRDYNFDKISLTRKQLLDFKDFIKNNSKKYRNANNDFIFIQRIPKNENHEFFIALIYSLLKLYIKEFFLIFEYKNDNDNTFFSLRSTEKTSYLIKKIVKEHDGHKCSRGIETNSIEELDFYRKKIEEVLN